MGIAGLWGIWRDKEGKDVLSFTMLTINADGHQVFMRLHKPGEEKRMVVILGEAHDDGWLTGSPDEARGFLRQFPAARLTAFRLTGR